MNDNYRYPRDVTAPGPVQFSNDAPTRSDKIPCVICGVEATHIVDTDRRYHVCGPHVAFVAPSGKPAVDDSVSSLLAEVRATLGALDIPGAYRLVEELCGLCERLEKERDDRAASAENRAAEIMRLDAEVDRLREALRALLEWDLERIEQFNPAFGGLSDAVRAARAVFSSVGSRVPPSKETRL